MAIDVNSSDSSYMPQRVTVQGGSVPDNVQDISTVRSCATIDQFWECWRCARRGCYRVQFKFYVYPPPPSPPIIVGLHSFHVHWQLRNSHQRQEALPCDCHSHQTMPAGTFPVFELLGSFNYTLISRPHRHHNGEWSVVYQGYTEVVVRVYWGYTERILKVVYC